MTPIVTADQMRVLEERFAAAGRSLDELGDRAARAVFEHATSLLSAGKSALVIAGPGNNGLDAVKAHRLLDAHGVSSKLYCHARTDCATEGPAPVIPDDCGVIVDGLFGIGLSRGMDDAACSIVRAVNAAKDREEPPLVVAVDVPSGLDATTGSVHGGVILADVTVTLGLPKRGLYTGHGPAAAGSIVIDPLGEEWTPDDPDTFALSPDVPAPVPARRLGAHKNQNGRVLVVGGSLEYPGAPVLAALAAQRCGAGYVTLAFPRSLYPAVAAHVLEQTVYPLAEAEPGALGLASVNDLGSKAEAYDVVVLGNGLGRHEQTISAVHRLLGLARPSASAGLGFAARSAQPAPSSRYHLAALVLDGDGLFALAAAESWPGTLPDRTLLTPHPGEMGRLLGISVEDVEAARIERARAAAREWGATVLLKGSYPLVASPDGRVDVLTRPHPALGTAGTGDVLAGICGRMLAAGMQPGDAARAALQIGSRVADAAVERVGRDLVSASDLISAIPTGVRHAGTS